MPQRQPNVRGAAAIMCLLLLFGGHSFAQIPPLEKDIAAGIAALKAGELEIAERIFSEVLRKGVKSPLVFHNLGVISQQRGNHAQAVAQFREAVRLQPDYAPSRLLAGSSLLALGKKNEAVHELKRAVTLLPEEPQARLQLAKAYEAAGDWLAVVQEYGKLVELAPQEAEYAYQHAKALTKLSEWSYREIARLSPNSARLHQSLGHNYLIQEKYDRAIVAYQQAARSDPKLPEIHLALALIWLELKRFDDALAEIELELKLAPESRMAQETKKKIEATRAASSK